MVAMTRRPQKKRKLILVGEDFLEYLRFPSFCHPFETKFCLEVEEKIKKKGQHHTPIWMKKPDKVLKALQALKPLFTRTDHKINVFFMASLKQNVKQHWFGMGVL